MQYVSLVELFFSILLLDFVKDGKNIGIFYV